MTEKDVIVIGAGAAGLMCAAEAGKRGRSVLVLEHSEKAGKKILISGGGRCNFTNRIVTSENFISGNPHFCKSALAGYTPDDFISLVEIVEMKSHAILSFQVVSCAVVSTQMMCKDLHTWTFFHVMLFH